MKVRHLLLLITQNAMCAVPKLVPAWQLPVYQEKFGETLGEDPEEQLVEVDALPDVEEEMARMQGIFGADPETKQSFVDLVFGRGPRALRELSSAMQDAVVADEPAAKPARAKKAKDAEAPPAGDAPEGDAALAALAGGTPSEF